MARRILVGTDLTSASHDALIQAEYLASRDGLPLVVAHVMSSLPWDSDTGMWPSRERVAELRESVCHQVTTLTGRPSRDFRTVIECGQPHVVLSRLAHSERALLVVGNHLQTHVGHALVKNVGERVAQHSYEMVWIAQPRTGSGRLLVAADDPSHSSVALRVASDEARRSGRKLTVVRCVNTGFVEDGVLRRKAPVAAAQALTGALRDELRKIPFDGEVRVLEGPPHALISDLADRLNAELIVIGASHHTQPLMDVTSFVIRRARCSVLVVEDVNEPQPGATRDGKVSSTQLPDSLHP